MSETDCIFCQIVARTAPCHKIWEDSKHLAFLSIFPNCEGTTVVITKEHHSSYIFDLSNTVINELMAATKHVAKLLDKSFSDVGRTGLVFEGFGVDHIHAKLFPLHGTKADSWKAHASSVNKYFDHYEGYISSHNFARAEDSKLAALAKRIREVGEKK